MPTDPHQKTSTSHPLASIVISYINASQKYRTERYRVASETKVRLHEEKQLTERARIQGHVEIARERELTARERIITDGRVAVSREQRRAFESFCGAIKSSLQTGQFTLDNLRQQFAAICQLMIERDLPQEERKLLLRFLGDVLDQQKNIASGNMKVLNQFTPDRYLPQSRHS